MFEYKVPYICQTSQKKMSHFQGNWKKPQQPSLSQKSTQVVESSNNSTSANHTPIQARSKDFVKDSSYTVQIRKSREKLHEHASTIGFEFGERNDGGPKPYKDITHSNLDISLHFDHEPNGKSTSRIISDNNLLSGLDGSGKTLDKSMILQDTPVRFRGESSQFDFIQNPS